MIAEANKLSLEIESVAHDINTIWTLKLSHQAFVAP